MTDLEARLASRWLASNGHGAVHAGIDPRDAMYRAADRYGVPPHRRSLVYMRDGAHGLATLRHVLACAGKPLGRVRRLLEFAAGHGRTTRFLVREVDAARIVASDVLPDAVQWCAEVLGTAGVVSDFEPSRVDFGARFDAIFVASLFSHLPEERFGEWLGRLYEALDDDGVLIFSVHAAAHGSEFTFRAESETDRLPTAEYGSTFATPAVVSRIAHRSGIRHVRHVERDLWGSQDVYAVTRREIAGLATWSSTPRVWGDIERIGVLDADRVGLAGVVRWTQGAPAIVEVRAALDGVDVGPIAAGATIVAEPADAHRAAILAREFHAIGPQPSGSRSTTLVEIIAVDERGTRTCVDVDALVVG